MDFEHILVEVQDGVATVALNRPNKLNALSKEVMGEIGKAFDLLAERSDVRVVVLAGKGGHLAAGADVTQIQCLANSKEGYEFALGAGKVYDKIYAFPCPVIASVSGYTLGGGCELALAADLRIAGETAVMGLPEVTLGLLPGGGGIQRLARLVGPARAKELLFTGKSIKADEAYRIGLVNQVVPAEQLEAEVNKLARKIASLPAYSIKTIKVAVNRGLDTDLTSALEIERQGFALLFSTSDMREGVAAFLEKRKPQFTGE